MNDNLLHLFGIQLLAVPDLNPCWILIPTCMPALALIKADLTAAELDQVKNELLAAAAARG